ncbi:methyltransferase domain protein [Oesophagostomum dentatum]|uniref:Methyltransferase domain protein n=1 Tax=Oesophagostomum dentatum TaxID=61180 RepID=A0A0B1T1K0_OESDE|nr:methyltransferase domain protein [Oesophagostomum dentatum]
MSSFPSVVFSAAQTRWVGKRCIVRPTIERALDNWQLVKHKRVLDVGCGSGRIGRDILENGASEVVGIDNSEKMIEIAKQAFQDERQQFLQGSILDCDLHGFDVAVAFFVLQFMENKEQLVKAIENIFNSLKSSGVLVVIVPNGVKNFNPTTEEAKKFGAGINLDSDPNLYDGRRVRVEFFEDGEMVGSSPVTFFFNETYEKTLKEAGFSKHLADDDDG